jgi:hypothetical protein
VNGFYRAKVHRPGVVRLSATMMVTGKKALDGDDPTQLYIASVDSCRTSLAWSHWTGYPLACRATPGSAAQLDRA